MHMQSCTVADATCACNRQRSKVLPYLAYNYLQMQLLQGLGVQNTIITDGKTPLNMYQSSHGIPPIVQQ